MATAASTASPLTLPPLPYAENALEPVISAKTLSFHHGKHHKTYVETTNKLIVGTELADLPLEQIVASTAGKPERVEHFQQCGAGVEPLVLLALPEGQGRRRAPRGPEAKDGEAFGSVDACKKELSAAAVAQFGSGWAWLVLEGAKLKVLKTADAETPIAHGSRPLLTIDVWEHAYYLDYQNRRVDHVNAVIEKLANWEFAAQNMSK